MPKTHFGVASFAPLHLLVTMTSRVKSIPLWGDPEESLLPGDPNLPEGTSSITELSCPAAPARMENFILSSTEAMSKIHAYCLQVI